MIGFVIGNGESRKGFDLERLRGKGLIVGFNALYREFVPDILMVRDQPMRKEIEEAGKGHLMVGLPEQRVMEIRGKRVPFPNHYKYTGTVGIWYMLEILKYDEVYLLGFDPYLLSGNRNNLYTGTKNYSEVAAPIARTRNTNLVKEMDSILSLNKQGRKWIRVGHQDDPVPQNWHTINWEEFDQVLNTKKAGLSPAN